MHGTQSRVWLSPLTVAVLFLLSTAPTLSRLEFSGSMENLNVATALEIRRTGNWLVPTLEGETRLNKPPLTAWVTAAFIRPSLVQRLNDTNPQARDNAYADLAFWIRLAAVLQTCGTIVLVGAIGTTLANRTTGGTAAAAYATSLLVLKLGRSATTDVQMTLWIALAFWGVTLALFRGHTWRGCMIAGIGAGLALMSKGPVSLLFIALPLMACLFLRTDASVAPARRLRLGGAPVMCGGVLAVLIGLPWYGYVYQLNPQVTGRWASEVTRVGATENSGSNPLYYLVILVFFLPWLPWVIRGAGGAIAELRRRVLTPAGWVLLSAALPLVVMSFFPDRKDRYALPAAIPLSVLAAIGLHVAWQTKRWNLLAGIHLAMVGAAVLLPIAGMFALQTVDGRPWYTPGFGIIATAVLLGFLAIGHLFRQRQAALVWTTLAVLLTAQGVMMKGYTDSPAGRSELKPLAEAIRTAHPAVGQVINARGDTKRVPVDLAIYLNHSTERVKDWRTLPPTTPPRIAVLPQKAGATQPAIPAGWRVIARVPRDRDFWWALVQE